MGNFKHGCTVGGKKTSEYTTWRAVLHRCYNKKSKRYKNYGKRGITVCQRWHEFINFLEDMGKRPSRQHSIDRKNNDLGYCPENCRWATKFEQARNRSDNRYIAYNNENKIITDRSRELGGSPILIAQRLKAGWTLDEALTLSARKNVFYTYNGESKTITDWAGEYALKESTLRERLRRGWSIEVSLTTPVNTKFRHRK